jgi:hypothetical protein
MAAAPPVLVLVPRPLTLLNTLDASLAKLEILLDSVAKNPELVSSAPEASLATDVATLEASPATDVAKLEAPTTREEASDRMPPAMEVPDGRRLVTPVGRMSLKRLLASEARPPSPLVAAPTRPPPSEFSWAEA